MNDDRIEQLLRKAPRPLAPAGLLDRLQTDITLPRRIETRPANPTEAVSLIRRWFPALSFAAIFLACIVAIALQTNQIAGLKHENATLQSSAPDLEQLRRDNAEYQRLKAAHEELERLRRDFAELQQLRIEVAQLRTQSQEIDRLRAENQQLLVSGRQAKSHADDDFFSRNANSLEAARARAERIKCVNNLKQIGLAARIYATDNGDVFPPNWLAITNELSTPKILICPSDNGRTPANDWRQFSTVNVSYEFLNPNGTDATPEVVLARCPIHNNVCLSDGSVQQLGKDQSVARNANDGKYYILGQPRSDPAAARQPRTKEEIDDRLKRYGLDPNAVRAATNRNGAIVVEPTKPSYE